MADFGAYHQAFTAFERAAQAGRAYLMCERVIDDLTTPVAAMLKIGITQKNLFLLESIKGGETRGRYSIIGLRPDQKFRIVDGRAQICAQEQGPYLETDTPPMTALRDFVADAEIEVPDDLPPMLSGVFGYIGYDMVRWIDDVPLPNKTETDIPQQDTPDALLIRPTLMAVFDSVRQEIIITKRIFPNLNVSCETLWKQAQSELDAFRECLLGPLQSPPVQQSGDGPALPPRHSNTPKTKFHEMVHRAKEYIAAGDTFQIVVSQQFSLPFLLPPFALYRALRKNNPSPFLFYLALDDFYLIGSSPEILVRVRGQTLTIRPIAGTRPRGKNEAEDQALEADLLADEKERAEHLMLVDLSRNDAGRVAKPGTVAVTKSFCIERYSKVLHLVSNVEAELSDDVDNLDALFSGFPHGTVSGAPKIRAMQIISELEQTRRGVYAGAVGYFSLHGDLDTCIALRTAVIQDDIMYVQAGAGIVLDSDDEAERQETLHKSQALFDAAAESWRFI